MHKNLMMLCLLPMLGHAMTTAQEELQRAAMPHAGLGTSGRMVKVHFAHLEGHSSEFLDDAFQRDLPGIQERCRERGLTPPTELPEFVAFVRHDNYYSPNRTIRYFRAEGYILDVNTCTVIDSPPHYQAILESSKGSCSIDLIKKTATGRCDPAIHAAAPATPRERFDRSGFEAQARAQQGTQMGDFLKSIIATVPVVIGKKKILGLECEVSLVPTPNTLACLTTGGSFQPTLNNNSGMLIESLPQAENARIAPKLLAVEAKLDTPVSEVIFSPHVGAGFTIREISFQHLIEKYENRIKGAK